jgi:hypothetical protein
MNTKSIFWTIAFACTALVLFADQKASPVADAAIEVGGKAVTINYGRPSVRGRRIFGGVVHYGALWMTGANVPTTLKTEAPLRLMDTSIQPGTYRVVTIPNKDKWTVIINRVREVSCSCEYDETQDVFKMDLPVIALDEPVEQFTISFQASQPDRGILQFEWEKVRIRIPYAVRQEAVGTRTPGQ